VGAGFASSATSIPVLDPGPVNPRGGRTRTGRFWVYARDDRPRADQRPDPGAGSPIAAGVLRRIAELYAIEREIRGHSAGERQSTRNIRSRPLVDAMKPWLEGQLYRVPPRGGLAEAIRYALARGPALCRFLDDGPEFVAEAVRKWIKAVGARIHCPDGPEARHELTFNMDQLEGADQHYPTRTPKTTIPTIQLGCAKPIAGACHP